MNRSHKPPLVTNLAGALALIDHWRKKETAEFDLLQSHIEAVFGVYENYQRVRNGLKVDIDSQVFAIASNVQQTLKQALLDASFCESDVMGDCPMVQHIAKTMGFDVDQIDWELNDHHTEPNNERPEP